MTLVESGRALSSVTELIRDHILKIWGSQSLQCPNVRVGRPEPPAPSSAPSIPALNLFLYDVKCDPFMRNVILGPARSPPVWVVCKYLLTAFDASGESDTLEALSYLGEGIRILDGLRAIPLNTPNQSPPTPLEDNPEVLKLTFEDTGVETLSRIMQGPDQRYRSSVGFEVRPVMIAPSEIPSYSLLVGIDYTKDPTDPKYEIDEDGINLDIAPIAMRPCISNIVPVRFETDAIVTIYGDNLNIEDLFVYLDAFSLRVTEQRKEILKFQVDKSIINGNTISAGDHTIRVVQKVSKNRERTSNTIIGNLLPKLDSAKPDSLSKLTDATTGQYVTGNLDIAGNLLGTGNDDILLGLYQNDRTLKILSPSSPGVQQTLIRVQIKASDRVRPGKYRVIYTVNGSQAKSSPEVLLDK